jgi:serine/threonine protein kinase
MADRLAVGAQVGSYRVASLIGASVRGGREMSVVYRAEHVRLGTPVALKVLAPEWSEDEAFRERFLHDVNLAATIDHPNVIPIYDADVHEESLYVVMRLVAGGGLKALLARTGPLDPELVPAALGPVAKALDAAHERGLVHGDVKPGNVLLHWSRNANVDHVYLTDFGMPIDRSAETELSQIGTTTDMFDYVSPEQLEGQEPTPKTDVYALGCVIYHSLTGRVPLTPGLTRFHGGAGNGGVEPPSQARRGLPAEVDAPVLEAMSRDPSRRPDTCEQVTRRLADALGVESGSIRGPWSAGVSAPLSGATGLAGRTALPTDGEPSQAAARAPAEPVEGAPAPETLETQWSPPAPDEPAATPQESRSGAPQDPSETEWGPSETEWSPPASEESVARSAPEHPSAPVERASVPAERRSSPGDRLPAPPRPPEAAHEPPPPGADDDGRPHPPVARGRKISGKTVAIVGAAVLAMVGGYVASNLGGGGGEDKGTQAVQPASKAGSATPAAAGPLGGLVTDGLPEFRCTVTQAAAGGQVLEHANCVPRVRDVPPIDRATITRFSSVQALDEFFERSRTLAGIRSRRSSEPCRPGPTWVGQGRWFTDRAGTEVGGRMFCSTPDEVAPTEEPRIVWTVDSSTILGEASAPDPGDLFSWWTRERNLREG